jgi:DNA invertase Pin-like site-specific DNA recombinase
MDERVSFILEWQAGQSSFAELCRAFGISRTLGYRYLNRYWESGLEGLQWRSSSPGRSWNRTE